MFTANSTVQFSGYNEPDKLQEVSAYRTTRRSFRESNLTTFGWLCRRGSPVPIPNTAVKSSRVDGTGHLEPGRVDRRPNPLERPLRKQGSFAIGGRTGCGV